MLIERELAAIERRCAAQAAIDAITAAGGHVALVRRPTSATARRWPTRWRRSVPTASASTCCSTPEAWRSAASCPTSRPTEFDLVFDVKVDGWFHLLRALGDTPIGTALVFSSIAGRFGNGGQTDYSAANDLLCKSVSSIPLDATRDPRRRHRLDGVGRHRHGQPRLDPEDDGAGRHRHAAAGRSESRWFGARSPLAGPGARSSSPAPSARCSTRRSHRCDPSAVAGAGPMVGQIATSTGRRWRRRRDRARSCSPALPGPPSHRGHAGPAGGDGHRRPSPRLPACSPPALRVDGHRGRRVPRPVQVVSRRASPAGSARSCGPGRRSRRRRRAVSTGRRMLPGQPEQVTTHFTGRVVLGPTVTDLGTMAPPRSPAGAVATPDAIYRVYFHGPAYQVLAGVWRDRRRHGRRVRPRSAGEPLPGGRPTRRRPSPRRAVLPDRRRGGACRGGKPRAPESGAPARSGAGRHRVRRPLGGRDDRRRPAVSTLSVLDGEGRVLVRLSGYETVALPGAAATDLLEPLEAALR